MLLGEEWGKAIDGKQGVPVLPPHLVSTTRCGKSLQRWKARRSIIVRQRDVLLKKYHLGLFLDKARHEDRIDRVNERIDACNRVIDLLEVAQAHEERVDHYEVVRVSRKKKRRRR